MSSIRTSVLDQNFVETRAPVMKGTGQTHGEVSIDTVAASGTEIFIED